MTDCKHEWRSRYGRYKSNPVEIFCAHCGKVMDWSDAMRRINACENLSIEDALVAADEQEEFNYPIGPIRQVDALRKYARTLGDW